MVQIDSWPADSKFPIGHYVKTLGDIGDKDTETQVLLIEHDIPKSDKCTNTSREWEQVQGANGLTPQTCLSCALLSTAPWSQNVLACLPKDEFNIDQSHTIGRSDFRNIQIFSIDPPGKRGKR